MRLTEYDKLVLLLVFGLAALADVLILIIWLVFDIYWSWTLLPVGWLVGALMTWGFGKWKN